MQKKNKAQVSATLQILALGGHQQTQSHQDEARAPGVGLVQKELSAVKELNELEDVMNKEAIAVNVHYNTVLSEFKLTFKEADSNIAEEMDY